MSKWLGKVARVVHPLATVVALGLAVTGNPQCAAAIAEAVVAAPPPGGPPPVVVVAPSGL